MRRSPRSPEPEKRSLAPVSFISGLASLPPSLVLPDDDHDVVPVVPRTNASVLVLVRADPGAAIPAAASAPVAPAGSALDLGVFSSATAVAATTCCLLL